MGGMFGAKQPQSQKQQPIGALNVQTSVYGSCLPYVYGKNRVPVNLIQYVDFKAIPHTEKQKTGGKGGGGGSSSNTTYTYSVSFAASFANGDVYGTGTVWKNKEKWTLSTLGLTLFKGAAGQTAWSYMTGAFPTQARPYADTAYIAAAGFDLGDNPALPNINLEVIGYLPYNVGTIDDAEPSAIVTDYLTHVRRGVSGFSTYLGNLDNGAASFKKYCIARGLFISPIENNQRAAGAFIKEIADITNSAVVWRNGKMLLVPYGDTAITGNGTTYTPDMTPLYDLTDDDFQFEKGQPPVKHSRKPQAQAYNHVRIEFNDRANDYNPSVVEVKDQADIDENGLRSKAVVSYKAITTAAVARDVAQLMLQRELYVRNVYSFRLGVRHSLLECMDYVTITQAPLGLDRQLVRIISVTEQDDYIDIEAEEVNIGVAHAPLYNTANPLGYNQDFNEAPGSVNDPLIMNAPGLLTQSGYEMWMAVSGQNPAMWGGAVVWVSDDNVEYRRVGEVYGAARYGALSVAMGAGSSNYDTSTVARVQLYNGQILGGTQADCDNFRTLLYVGGEWMSYRDAVLVSGTTYDLDTFHRAAYGSTRAAHSIGDAVAVIDEAIFKLPYDKGNIGNTIYIKFQSFNVFGGATEDLASCTAWTHTVGASEKTAPMEFVEIAGSGINLMLEEYSRFNATLPALTNVTSTMSTVASSAAFGGFYLRAVTGGTNISNDYTLFAINSTDYHMPFEENRDYIISLYAYSNVAGHQIRLSPYFSSGSAITVGDFALTTTRTRYQFKITIPAGENLGLLRAYWNRSGVSGRQVNVDGIMIEPMIGSLIKASPFVPGSASRISYNAFAAAAAAQDTADGKIQTYFQSSPPSHPPASVGDLWFDTNDGNKVYRSNGTTWVLSADDDMAQAILDAAGAQATADGKITTFYKDTAPVNADAPNPPGAIQLGDLWYNRTDMTVSRWNGSAWIGINGSPTTGGDNLLPNPQFTVNTVKTPDNTNLAEDDVYCDGWKVYSIDDDGLPNISTKWMNTTAIRMIIGNLTANPVPAGALLQIIAQSVNFIPVVAGRTYKCAFQTSGNAFNGTIPGTVDVRVRMNVRWYDATGTQIAGGTGYVQAVQAASRSSSSESDQVVAPAGAALAKVELSFYVKNNGGSAWTPAGSVVGDIKFVNASFTKVALMDSDIQDDVNYGRTSNLDLYSSGGFNRIGLRIPGSGHRIGDQRNLNRSLTSAYGMSRTTTALSATSTGAVSVLAHTVRYGSFSVSYNAVSNAVTGLTQGVTYVIYCTDATLSGGTKTYFAGTNPTTVMNISDDIYVVGQITIPTSGSSSGGGGGGGTNPGDWCVAAESFMPDGTLAEYVKRGKMVPCYNQRPNAPNIQHWPAQYNDVAEAECLRLVTETGASIIASTTTPMTLRNGATCYLPEMLNREVLVYRLDGTFTWEYVTELQPVGLRRVARISVHEQCYFAGETKEAFIATHNNLKP